MNEMFCFQCEQTAGCKGCMGKAGVCGKSAEVAHLQDQLTGALIGLSKSIKDQETVSDAVWNILIDGLFMTITNVHLYAASIQKQIDAVHDPSSNDSYQV